KSKTAGVSRLGKNVFRSNSFLGSISTGSGSNDSRNKKKKNDNNDNGSNRKASFAINQRSTISFLTKTVIPKKLNPIRQKALKAIEAKNYEEALEYCERLIQLHPNSCTFRCDRAEVLLNLGKNSEALKDLDKVLNLKPNKLHALYL